MMSATDEQDINNEGPKSLSIETEGKESEEKAPFLDDTLDDDPYLSDSSPVMVSLIQTQDPESHGEIRRSPSFSSITSSIPLPTLSKPAVPRDILPAGAFIIQFLISLLLAAYGNITAEQSTTIVPSNITTNSTFNTTNNITEIPITNDDNNIAAPQDVLHGLNVTVVCVSFVYSLAWLVLVVRPMKKELLWACGGLSLLGWIPLGLFCFAAGGIGVWMGVLAFASAIADALWMARNQCRLDFVTVLLDMVTMILQENSMLVYLTVAVLAIHSAWAIWAAGVIAQMTGDSSSFGWSIRLIWMYFHFYWTSRVLQHIVTTFVSGTVMMWYYGRVQLASPPPSPTRNSARGLSSMSTTFPQQKVAPHFLKLALTTSFGSVCIGSLFCQVAHLLWMGMRWAKRPNALRVVKYLFESPPEVLVSFVRHYHKYSFTHVAAYSKSFRVAANDTWCLLEERGVEAIIDDDLTSRLLHFAANGGAGIATVFCGTALYDTPHWVFGATLFFVLGYCTTSIATQLVVATVKTLFVCFAQNPKRLSQLSPIIYHRLVRISELRSFRNQQQEEDNEI